MDIDHNPPMRSPALRALLALALFFAFSLPPYAMGIGDIASEAAPLCPKTDNAMSLAQCQCCISKKEITDVGCDVHCTGGALTITQLVSPQCNRNDARFDSSDTLRLGWLPGPEPFPPKLANHT